MLKCQRCHFLQKGIQLPKLVEQLLFLGVLVVKNQRNSDNIALFMIGICVLIINVSFRWYESGKLNQDGCLLVLPLYLKGSVKLIFLIAKSCRDVFVTRTTADACSAKTSPIWRDDQKSIPSQKNHYLETNTKNQDLSIKKYPKKEKIPSENINKKYSTSS